MAKERLYHLDVAKGVLIILLVIQHFWIVSHGNGIDTIPFDSHFGAWQLIFISFFMPAFFFITGYCSNFDKPAKVFVWNQVKTLLVPLLTFQLIDNMFMSVRYVDYSWLSPMVGIPNSSFWFLSAMFLCKLFYYLLKRFIKVESYLLIASFVVSILGVFLIDYFPEYNFFACQHALIAVVFLGVGEYLRFHPSLFGKVQKYSLILFPWLYLLLIMFKRDIPYLTGAVNIPLQYIPVFYALSFMGTLSLVKVCMKINRNVILEYLGAISLTVYGLHYLAYSLIKPMLWDVLSPVSVSGCGLFEVLSMVMAIGFCAIGGWFFKLKPICWLLGKW